MAQRRKRTTSVKKPNTSGEKKPLNLKKLAIIAGCVVGGLVLAAVIAVIVILNSIATPTPDNDPVFDGCYQGSQVEYTLEGYEEYYTGEFKLKKIGDPDYYWGNNGGYFELYNPAGMQVVTVGDMYNDFKYDATYTPDEFKQNVLTHYQNYWQISDERMELVQFKLYLPVETVRFSIESADLNGGVATVVLNYGSVEGELVPLTLSGTYTVESGAVTLEYSTETDELATVLVENLLKSASYSYYADESTNTWVNTLTFGNKISLTHN